MKQTFTKYFGRITEKLELSIEEKWIYVHYTKGNFEKTSCILKNEDKPIQDYLSSFYKENSVSEAMKKEIEKYLMNMKNESNTAHWKEFTAFLMKALSLHLVLGVTIAIMVYGGYQLGAKLDSTYDMYPLFTLLGLFIGLGIGGLAGFSMIKKHSKDQSDKKEQVKQQPVKTEGNAKNINLDQYPIIDIDLEDVRKAVRQFSDHLPKGVYRTILVNDDNSIDFAQLIHILNGVPSKQFYMSKETYDLFEEKDKQIPVEMDIVQRAVDQYVKDKKEYPMLKFDPQRRVNYYTLLQEHYLKAPPDIQFYITDLDGLVTHIKPEKKMGNSS